MGIVAYEISKRNPRSIHGVDTYEPAIVIAQRIFMAVDVEHRFEVADVTDERKMRSTLAPSYDIILMLSVWHHLRKRQAEKADAAVRSVAERCREWFVARVPPSLVDTLRDVLAPIDFRLNYQSSQQHRHLGVFLAFEKSKT
jgi:hypothetical protein